MDTFATDRELAGEEGFVSVQFAVAAGLALAVVVMLVQVIAYQYVTGAVTLALERGVRSASTAGGGVDDCEEAIADSLDGALGGAIRGSLVVECRADVNSVWAGASGSVSAWTIAGPDLTFDLEAQATRETAP